MLETYAHLLDGVRALNCQSMVICTAHPPPRPTSCAGDLHFFSYHIMTPQIKLGTLDASGNLCYTLNVSACMHACVHACVCVCMRVCVCASVCAHACIMCWVLALATRACVFVRACLRAILWLCAPHGSRTASDAAHVMCCLHSLDKTVFL